MTLPIAFRRRWPIPMLAITLFATFLATLTGPTSGVGLGVQSAETVVDVLGNAPAVSRQSYIAPVVVEAFLAGLLPASRPLRGEPGQDRRGSVHRSRSILARGGGRLRSRGPVACGAKQERPKEPRSLDVPATVNNG